jgi:hypothetical protein
MEKETGKERIVDGKKFALHTYRQSSTSCPVPDLYAQKVRAMDLYPYEEG